ncbi:hypothetical protein BJ138DRAFT_32752 [Hygrophoropsis aurantiaca]|uniref:Uncharacterized protein n=1 Tax=Hygrophoropsis aurantiaca TaxID=72124 RepID=A0ACB8AD89_9AGAM|nr:hypothetical protein BJ138DRAFT_32752 [Hygrophoropsis aurantiaca]
MLVRLATPFVILLASFWYRSGRVAKNNILNVPNLPDGYYQDGDWKQHCKLVSDEEAHTINYCEDMTFWDHFNENGQLADRYVLLGCDPNRKAWNTVMGPLRDPAPRGYLWLYSTTEGGKPRRITLQDYPESHDFHPLGLEISPSRGGNQSNLFVVNHGRERTTIEQFALDPVQPYQAKWTRTLSSPYFISPNALALTSPTSFYVSNDHLMTRRLPNPIGHILPIIESVAGLPLGWLSHVSLDADGTLHHEFSAFGVPFANGVALSPDGTQLALSSTSLAEIYFYTRNTTTNALKHIHTVPMPMLSDNIMYDDAGILIVTGHPHFPSLIAVAANKTDARAPSWAVSVSPLSPDTKFAPSFANRMYDMRAPLPASTFAPATLSHEVETLFQSNGSAFSSSCTSLRDSEKGILYMVGLYEEGLLVCRP